MNKRDIKRLSTFAGVAARHPLEGDWVKVTEGERKGEIYKVILVDGYVFGPAFRVYVETPQKELLWYWPWNIKIAT